MLLKGTNPFKKAPGPQENAIKGIYMTKEMRIETKKEITRAHFDLGQKDLKFPAQSYSHSHFANGDVPQNKSQENKKIAQEIKKTHFTIGDALRKESFFPQRHQTPSNLTNHQQIKLDQSAKTELRKAHFAFGSDPITYETTHQQVFNPETSKRSESDMNALKSAQTERKLKMRQQNFVYGTDVPSYLSMAKGDFPTHNNSEAFENLVKSKQNGLELRKSHFQFGTDPVTFQRTQLAKSVANLPTKDHNPQAKTHQIPLYIPLAKKTNIDMNYNGLGGDDCFQYETVSGTQMAQVRKNDPKVRAAQANQVKEMKQDLRNAHFHFGNHEQNYESTAKGTLVSHDPKVSAQVQQLAHELGSKMQTVSFKIGDEKRRDLKGVQTTYKQTISEHSLQFRGANVRSASQIGGARTTNIKIGSEPKVDYISEQKEKFTQQAQSALQSNPNRAKELRMHHFTLQENTGNGGKPNNYFETVNKIDFNNKGNPNEIRSFIPAEVKENQRSSHFKVGFEYQSPFVHHPSAQQQDRPASAAFVKSVNAPLATKLPAPQGPASKKVQTSKEINSQSHIFTQQPRPAAGGQMFSSQYQTSNKSYFRWIQPSTQ